MGRGGETAITPPRDTHAPGPGRTAAVPGPARGCDTSWRYLAPCGGEEPGDRVRGRAPLVADAEVEHRHFIEVVHRCEDLWFVWAGLRKAGFDHCQPPIEFLVQAADDCATVVRLLEEEGVRLAEQGHPLEDRGQPRVGLVVIIEIRALAVSVVHPLQRREAQRASGPELAANVGIRAHHGAEGRGRAPAALVVAEVAQRVGTLRGRGRHDAADGLA